MDIKKVVETNLIDGVPYWTLDDGSEMPVLVGGVAGPQGPPGEAGPQGPPGPGGGGSGGAVLTEDRTPLQFYSGNAVAQYGSGSYVDTCVTYLEQGAIKKAWVDHSVFFGDLNCPEPDGTFKFKLPFVPKSGQSERVIGAAIIFGDDFGVFRVGIARLQGQFIILNMDESMRNPGKGGVTLGFGLSGYIHAGSVATSSNLWHKVFGKGDRLQFSIGWIEVE